MTPVRPALSVCLTAALLAAGGPPLPAQPVRVGENTPVARDAAGHSLVETQLAVHPADPRHLLAVAIAVPAAPMPYDERRRRQRCVAFLSRDGGRRWTRQDLPVAGCFDPWAAITPDGHAVVALLGTHARLPQHPDELLVLHSPDGGATWDPLPTPLGRGYDHVTVAVDTTASPRRGWVYVLSGQTIRADEGRLRFAVVVARSRTRGRTFDAPVRGVPNSLHVLPEMPAVLPDGTLVVSYVDAQWNVDDRWADAGTLERRRAWVLRSADGGTTFSMPLFASEACGPPRFQLSALAADRSAGPFAGRLYFACQRHGGGALALSWSPDGGERWSAPALVHAAPADTAVIREMPAMAVSPRGVLGVAWVDTRDDLARRCFAVYFAPSRDGGQTFLPERRVSTGRSCPAATLNGGSWLRGGDYLGMVALPDGSFRLVWADARDGAFALWTAAVTVDAAPPAGGAQAPGEAKLDRVPVPR